MKFEIGKGSDCNFKEVREINTLEGLLGLLKEFGNDIVVGEAFKIGSPGHDYRVTVYDSYLE